ncbi:hypothetical protein J8657_13700 [Dickeya oryzae]|uniref:DUF3330 domain-containing protein n=1 Tax=Dickeya oryzae TaxID=1240404 RepID=A0ABS5BE23_9GAMM|nr:hypothetical protein [Dickeya oryzae]MBP2858656.1 hypothetical protein [Dickeya oryzae]
MLNTDSLRQRLQQLEIAEVAVCIGCGCDDNHACVDEFHDVCGWLAVDRNKKLGVCSFCSEHLERWHQLYAVNPPLARLRHKSVGGEQ